MNALFADSVHAFFNHGISLRERLDAGEPVNVGDEKRLLEELLAAFDSGKVAEADLAFDFSDPALPDERRQLSRTTIRYALVCWLDEWLVEYSAQGQRWREQSLERALYGSDEGSAKFWEEARYAETRADFDALEVMHLCVVLGFRGDRRKEPDQLEKWATRIRARLAQVQPEWAMPASLEPARCELQAAADLPYRGMAFSMLLTAALALPLVAVLLWRLSI